MKRLPIATITAVTILLSAHHANAEPSNYYNVNDFANGLEKSRHNLGALGNFYFDTTSATTEICVFCHTPHVSGAPDVIWLMAPLWNRKSTAIGTYVAYGTTLSGTAQQSFGPTTLACLSCRDGVTTYDSLINAPGPHNLTLTEATDMGWSFTNDGIAVVDDITPHSRLVIGTNLTNDHPISINYIAGRASLRPANTIISTIDLSSQLAVSAATYDASNLTRNLWAVEGLIKDDKSISDILREGKVECVSCHDPHFSNRTAVSADQGITAPGGIRAAFDDGLFLRRVGGNVGSGVCRTCHNK